MSARLVLLHGFTGSRDSWADVVAHLAPGVRVLEPVLGGHGRASAPDFMGEAWRLIGDAEGWSRGDRVHLAGYSLGARLALAMAVERPDLFASLTLVGVNPGLRSDAERAERRAADAKWIELLGRGIEPFVDAWEQLPLWATQARLPAEARQAQRAARLAQDPRGLGASLRATGLGEMPDLRPRLAGLPVPVTLLAGAEDPKFRTLAEEIAALLPKARVVVVPDAGHNLLLERPEAVARELNRNIR